MNQFKLRLKGVVLTILSFLLVVGLGTPAFGSVVTRFTAPTSQNPGDAQMLNVQDVLAREADLNVKAAELEFLAQGIPSSGLKKYVAVMSGSEIVPKGVRTDARGAVGAALAGNRLIVRGSFRALSSGLRDYATDPLDPPNPNITSALHIHRGSPMENGPFQYALDVMVNSMGTGGSATGEYTLTDEQVAALNNNMLYVDLHTTRYRAGELRAILMEY
ncbi:CHRD domain-containing protein [Leptolyngbya sp. PCC 6406]|uniref:CHRD domain-containing protein n=1 Tax=Leptolyngbya sp. PCC 6406 TaxID=1173264 RepID=UPI0002AC4588|nr:CHRD domain-containing protein [Leptolyngbya sp. PCC 6406]